MQRKRHSGNHRDGRGHRIKLFAFILATHIWPLVIAWWLQGRRSRRLDALQDRCRKIYEAGEAAQRAGDKRRLQDCLRDYLIQQAIYRHVTTLPARAWHVTTVIGFAAMPGALWRWAMVSGSGVDPLLSLVWIGLSVMWAIVAYVTTANYHYSDDRGWVLQHMLDNWRDRHVDDVNDPHEPATGDIDILAELLGVKPGFSRKDLDRARRRRAAELHPDGMMAASASDRRAAEERLKNVNAAHAIDSHG